MGAGFIGHGFRVLLRVSATSAATLRSRRVCTSLCKKGLGAPSPALVSLCKKGVPEAQTLTLGVPSEALFVV